MTEKRHELSTDRQDAFMSIQNISKKYGSFKALANVSLEVFKGEILSVIGPNGSGKSTFLALIAGDLYPDGGTITVDGKVISHLPMWKRSRLGIARTYQTPRIIPKMTVFEHIRIVVQGQRGSMNPVGRRNQAPVLDRVYQTLEEFDLTAVCNKTLAELPHGDRSWVELAMLFARGPGLILLDEPTAGVGAERSKSIEGILKTKFYNQTIVIVEHDLDVVRRISDRVLVLDGGEVVVIGTVAEISADESVVKSYLPSEINSVV